MISQIDVGGLSERETAELVRISRPARRPSRAFAHALHDETEGNPLFVEEIVRHLAEAGVRAGEAGAAELQRFGLPEGVKQVIARRLARLERAGDRVAAGRGRDRARLRRRRCSSASCSLDEDEFLNALDEALAAGLVVETGRTPAATRSPTR